MSASIAAVIIQIVLLLFLPYWLMKISRRMKIDQIFSDILKLWAWNVIG